MPKEINHYRHVEISILRSEDKSLLHCNGGWGKRTEGCYIDEILDLPT